MVISALWLIGIILLGSIAFGAHQFAPWLPTWNKDLERFANLAGLKQSDVVYDLGSGDGRVVFFIARRFQAKAVGVEVAIPLVIWSYLKKIVTGATLTTFLWKNFFKLDVSPASVIYVFGRPGTLGALLVDKFKRELRPGSRIVSYAFPLAGLVPEKIDKPTKNDLSLYLYRI